MDRIATVSGTTNLLDILDRVLDKGLVIAGDIRVSLANVELLTIRIRLLVCSVDKAEQIGLNWWKFDPNLTAPSPAQKALPGRVNPIEVREPARGPGKRAGQPGRKRG
ncbi:MAG TPA: gas vesicle protein [Terriglobales bacterium]|nr:gas vesicle protein [Terriglobales bacterium]